MYLGGDQVEWQRVYSGSGGEARVGYCRAILLPDVGGDWIRVSGTTGFDYAAGVIAGDPTEQTEQTLRNIGTALSGLGASWADVYYYRAYVRDAAVWESAVPVLAARLGPLHPAATAVIAPAMEGPILIEIEVAARRRPPAE